MRLACGIGINLATRKGYAEQWKPMRRFVGDSIANAPVMTPCRLK